MTLYDASGRRIVLGNRDTASFRRWWAGGTTPVERWYAPVLQNATALTTASPTRDVLRAAPFLLERDAEVELIAANVTTGGATSKFRLGIYRHKSETEFYPGDLILDSGELDAGSSGVKSASVSAKLAAGVVHWVTHISGVAVATFRAITNDSLCPLLGWPTGLSGTPGCSLAVSFSYAALPSTFPGSATISSGTIPLVAVRFAA